MITLSRVACLLAACILFPCAGASPYPVRVERAERFRAVDLFLVNDGPAPINVVVDLTQSINTGFSPVNIGSKFPHFLPPNTRTYITTAVPLKKSKPSQFAYRLVLAFGDPKARHNDDAVYRLPFADDRLGVMRTYSGEPLDTPSFDTSRAVEFAVPRGTPIVAARSGTVISIFGADDGDDLQTSPIGSYVKVLHDDGTWADYGWLDRKTFTVAFGERVETGQHLADAEGNPNSATPYIYFSVTRNLFAMSLRGVPVRFKTAGGDVVDAMSYTGPVATSADPLPFPVQDPRTPIWTPPDSYFAAPPPVASYGDEHLSPAQRQALFRKRLLEQAHGGQEPGISSSTLGTLALFALIVGSFSVAIAVNTARSADPAGLPGWLWTLLHRRSKRPLPPGSIDEVDSGEKPVSSSPDAPGQPAAVAPAVAADGAGSSLAADAPAPLSASLAVARFPREPLSSPSPSVLGAVPGPSDQPLPTPLLLSDFRREFYAKLQRHLPEGRLIVPDYPVERLLPGARDLLGMVVDYLVVSAQTGDVTAAILVSESAAYASDRTLLSKAFDRAALRVLMFDDIPTDDELKAALRVV